MMTNATLQCTVCQSTSVMPRVHANMLMKDGVQTYCATCNALRNHMVVSGSGNSHPTAAAASSAPPSRMSGVPGGGTAAPGGVATSRPASNASTGHLDDDALWRTLETRLSAAHITLDDVFKADDATRGRLFASLNFDTLQEARLHRLVTMKVGPPKGAGGSSAGATSPPARLPTATADGPYGGGGGFTSPNSINTLPTIPSFTTPGAMSAGSGPANARLGLTLGSSAIPGLTVQGDTLVARCSVFPHLPAEFWCCACNVLVSSRCHVTGIHKDHPFITLRLAAEAHVRDLSGWNERCRTQLNVASSVVNNLRHADTLAQTGLQQQMVALDEHVNVMIEDLKKWRDQLKHDMSVQVASQSSSIDAAIKQTEGLFQIYSQCLGQAEPLMTSIPPVEGNERNGEEWALRVLDLVSRLKHIHTETIPMPKVIVPQVTCQATPATNMELLKCVAVPLSVRLPEVMDPGYFNFPHPSVSARVPFTLQPTDEAASKGVVLYNGRTLTRAQDVVPSHCLVMSSQVFYNGSVSWEVHIDRLGAGASRVLLGVVVNGTDGEGVVWDGPRIVGPNEGECRNIDERYVWRQGTVLRFHLELDPPQCYLNCFFDRDGVARIPLPATGLGWTPAFSVFGPQDQITVVPHINSQGNTLPRIDRRPVQRAAGDTVAHLERQDHLIASLHQQIQTLQNRLEQETMRQGAQNMQANAHFGLDKPSLMGSGGGGGGQSPIPDTIAQHLASGGPASSTGFVLPQGVASPMMQGPGGGNQRQQQPAAMTTARGLPIEAYSPELRQLMRYVDDIGT